MTAAELDTMYRLVHQYAAVVAPGHCRVELVIHQRTASPACIPLPLSVEASPDTNLEIELSEAELEREDNILRAVQENPDKKLTGEKLAPLAGYEFATSFRLTLGRLVRENKLVATRSGYVLGES